jgi:hypothetical protein
VIKPHVERNKREHGLSPSSTSQALVLRQLRQVTSHITTIGSNESLEDCIFFLHDRDEAGLCELNPVNFGYFGGILGTFASI